VLSAFAAVAPLVIFPAFSLLGAKTFPALQCSKFDCKLLFQNELMPKNERRQAKK
jgi:hypothetical protein